jgi:hypothetical protein
VSARTPLIENQVVSTPRLSAQRITTNSIAGTAMRPGLESIAHLTDFFLTVVESERPHDCRAVGRLVNLNRPAGKTGAFRTGLGINSTFLRRLWNN